MDDLLFFSLIVSSHQNLIMSSIDISEASEEERKERRKMEEVKTSLDCPPPPIPPRSSLTLSGASSLLQAMPGT